MSSGSNLLQPRSCSIGNIMVEYEYPECTTSVITSLSIFRKHYPHYRSPDIEYVTVPFFTVAVVNV